MHIVLIGGTLFTIILILFIFSTPSPKPKDKQLEYVPFNYSLNQQMNDVLDIYTQSGIKIPLDIIEELSYLNLDDNNLIYEYIENQRYHWKLENTKKPYRRP